MRKMEGGNVFEYQKEDELFQQSLSCTRTFAAVRRERTEWTQNRL